MFNPDANACAEVLAELIRARASNSDFHSAHEGLSVLFKEYRELELEVFKKRTRDRDKLRKEAMQVAAMAVRFMVDITG